MDQVLSSLFPSHQVGSDGFNWWIGQIESNSSDDPKKSGRYKVRIVGQHLKDCNSTATKDLPWGQCDDACHSTIYRWWYFWWHS